MNKEGKVELHELIIKFFAGEISENEMIILNQWLDHDPENRRIFDKENELWQEISYHTKLASYKADTAWMNISTKLRFAKNNQGSVRVLKKNSFRILIAAASIACLLAIGSLSLWINGRTHFQEMTAASTSFSTHEGEKAHIFLADSTEIILNSGSTLQCNGLYNIKDRVVKFTGEAYFIVRTNPEMPFVVNTNQISVSATGTRFNIFSYDNEDKVETTLEEGVLKVSIKGKEPINVKSGQQVVYSTRSEKVQVRAVATDTYTSWTENKLRFNDTPFEEVLRRISRRYNVRFEISSRELLNLKYTATFIDESIVEVMQMLREVSPITFKIYTLTSINDKHYLKPKIVVGKRKN